MKKKRKNINRIIYERVKPKLLMEKEWDNEEMLIIGECLFSSIQGFPDHILKSIKQIGDTYNVNNHYINYTEKGVIIAYNLHDDEEILISYNGFVQLLEKWGAFLRNFLADDFGPEELIITMDDEYNFTFEYVLNNEKKVI